MTTTDEEKTEHVFTLLAALILIKSCERLDFYLGIPFRL